MGWIKSCDAISGAAIACWRPSLLIALAIGLIAPSLALANPGDMAFGFRPSYNNVPDWDNPGNFDPHIVVYSLPATGPYAGPVDSFFDVYARVDGGGTQHAAGYGLIAVLSGSGELIFTTPDPNVSADTNVDLSRNPSFPKNLGFDQRIGDTSVPNFPSGHRTNGIIGIHSGANTNVSVTDSDGLLSLPIRVQAGTAGMFTVTAQGSTEYSGFVETSGTLLTFARYPHLSGTIEVRPSLPGDFNGDGAVNEADRAGFMAAASNTTAFRAQYPWLQTLYIGDFNQDGAVTASDLPGFNAAVGVPEPATAAMLAGAVTLLIGAARRRLLCGEH